MKPAAMLVRAFEVHDRVAAPIPQPVDASQRGELLRVSQREGVGRAGVEPDVGHVVDLLPALPGPFTDAAPVDPATGAVAVGLAGFPFGWAFDVSAVIPPGSPLAAILQATVGFMPAMTWLQVIAWALYIAIVGGFWLRGLRPRVAARTAPDVARAGGRPPVHTHSASAQPSTPQGAA